MNPFSMCVLHGARTCVGCVDKDSGGSSAQHVPGKFCHHPCEGEGSRGGREGREERRQMEEGYKKRGNMGGDGDGQGRGRSSPKGEDERMLAFPFPGGLSPSNLGSHPLNMAPLCHVHLSFCPSHPPLTPSVALSLIHLSEV